MTYTSSDFRIEIAADMKAVAVLFREYASELDEDFCFQGFEEEIAGLPGKYVIPHGAILIATEVESGKEVGIVALRPFGDSGQSEMKRMYVRSEYRGRGIGRLLAIEIISEAKRLEYTEMLLDTLKRLQPAIHLYKDLGFEEIEAYYENPIDGVVYLRKVI